MFSSPPAMLEDHFPPPPAPFPTSGPIALHLPPTEDRPYRYVSLPNGVEAVVISDADAPKAAACILIEAGTMNDPRDLPGCAHLCERLAVRGSENFPDPDGFKTYIDEHGGSRSAGTHRPYTSHWFDVSPPALYGALARAADFVINPLFPKDQFEREVNARESEFKLQFNNDGVRGSILRGSLAKTDHPFNHFNRGNRETLLTIPKASGRNPRDEVAAWWKTNYCARRMKVVVAGTEDSDTLQAWVEELFGPAPVVTDGLPPTGPNGVYRTHDVPYGADEVGKVAFMKPMQDIRKLEIHIPVPDDRHLHATQPFLLASLAISYVGKGSVASMLKRKEWVSDFACYSTDNTPGFGELGIHATLTSEGLEHWAEVVGSTFTAINFLKANTRNLCKFFEEQRQVRDLIWRVLPKVQAHHQVVLVAQRLRHPVPRDLVISSETILDEFDPELVEAALDHFKLENSVALISSKELPANVAGSYDKTEPIYGTLYTLRDLNQFVSIAEVDNALHLPRPNPYVSSQSFDVSKVEVPDGPPQLLVDTPVSRLWYKQDVKLDRSLTHVNIKLASPIVIATPGGAVLNDLLGKLFAIATTEEEDDAGLAGLWASTGPGNSHGHYQLEFQGPTDTVGLLTLRFVSFLRNFDLDDPVAFSAAVEEVKAGYNNFMGSQQSIVAYEWANYAVQETAWTNEDKLQALEGLTLADLVTFRHDILGRLHIESFVYGSMSADSARALLADIEQILQPQPPSPAEIRGTRSLLIPEGYDGIWEQESLSTNSTNAIVYSLYAERGADDVRARTLVALLHEIAKTPFSDALLVNEQLCEFARTGSSAIQGTLVRFHVLAQSERHPAFLESRITEFLDETLGRILRDLSDDDFARHVQRLVSQLEERPVYFMTDARHYWQSIMDGYYEFDRRATDAVQLRATTKAELLAFYNSAIHSGSPTRRKLSVRIRAKGLERVDQPAGDYIEDITSFKDSLVAAKRAAPVRPAS